MRNEEASAAGRLKPYLKTWEVTFIQRRCRTRHIRPIEVQVLNAHGKVQLGDIPCVVEVRKGREHEE